MFQQAEFSHVYYIDIKLSYKCNTYYSCAECNNPAMYICETVSARHLSAFDYEIKNRICGITFEFKSFRHDIAMIFHLGRQTLFNAGTPIFRIHQNISNLFSAVTKIITWLQ